MKIQVELNLEDVFDEAIYNEVTLKEAIGAHNAARAGEGQGIVPGMV